jgi:NAD(P)-dependent dehydrogenase (short-subunit alcohol dehydrogenase family)
MSRDLPRAVVVLTGGSSGIGRAAAHAFAAEGARIVLAARGGGPLAVAVEECRVRGAEAVAVPTDVRDEAAVVALRDAALERFGRVDVWVNGAGVMAYGAFEQMPGEVFRKVIETNLFGQVHGARAVLPVFRRQGSGVLVNMASVWGRVTTPYVSPYVTSKFAVRAFSECLRAELRGADGIDVATMLPGAVDTPIFHNAGNFSGRRVRPIPPLLAPEDIAEGIVRCAQDPKREVTYGANARILEVIHAIAPGLYERFAPPAFRAGNFADAPAERHAGNITAASTHHDVNGGWRSAHRRELARALLAAARGTVSGLLGRR